MRTNQGIKMKDQILMYIVKIIDKEIIEDLKKNRTWKTLLFLKLNLSHRNEDLQMQSTCFYQYVLKSNR